MRIDELQSLLLVTTPSNEVLKVSHVYDTTVTAEVVYPLPPRTQVRTLTAEDIDNLRPCSDRMQAKYEAAWGVS